MMKGKEKGPRVKEQGPGIQGVEGSRVKKIEYRISNTELRMSKRQEDKDYKRGVEG